MQKLSLKLVSSFRSCAHASASIYKYRPVTELEIRRETVIFSILNGRSQLKQNKTKPRG